MELVFFHAHRDYLMKMLPPGEVRVVSGKLEVFNDRLQMTHPDHIAPPSEAASLQTVEPVYPLKIGRASCRERVCPVRVDLGGRRILKKKTTNKQTTNQQTTQQKH